jgi:hypothetical protein
MLKGFWPSNNWKVNYECASICTVIDVDLKNPIIPPYYGPKSMRPFLNNVAYMFFCDLFVRNFVLAWPLDPTVYPIWMGKAESDVVKYQENENYGQLSIQWWVHVKKGPNNDEELYHNCWLSKWKCNDANLK